MRATPRRQRVAERGADCETDTKPPQTSPIHTSANQETRSGKNSPRSRNRRVKAGGGKISLKKIFSGLGQLEFSNLATGGKDHILKHMYTQTEILELTGSDHNLLPPRPPHSGKDITAAQTGRPIQTQNHHSHPPSLTPLPPQNPCCSFLLLFLLCCFSLSSSVAFRPLLS